MASDSPILRDRLEGVASAVAGALGLQLYDLDYKHAGQRRKVITYIDRPGSGVSLADCEAMSRQLSRELDVLDLIPSAYDLEVSSPGLDRRIRTEAHWSGAVGLSLDVKFTDSARNPRTETLRVIGLEAGTVILARASGEQLAVALPEILTARVHVEW